MPGILHTYIHIYKLPKKDFLTIPILLARRGIKRNYSLLSLASVKAQIQSSAMKLKTILEKRLENGMPPAFQSLCLKLECAFSNLCIDHVCLKSGCLSYVTLSVDIR